jgi:glycosyltransferase involved in cell wall biosynthesis
MRPLTFCDLATCYCPTGGGIRTYYNAKLEWFRCQTTHRYVLIVPGQRSSTREVSASVTMIEARGVCVSRASDSYRLFRDFAHIRSAIREYRPDVVETGDPWVSGPFALWLRRHDRMPSILSSFFHADPMPTYVEPALARYTPQWMARALAPMAGRAFYRLQRSYDLTMVSSECSADRLTRAGVRNVRLAPFGVDATFFDVARRRETVHRRLLYAGRLDRDKQVDLLITILPRLLEDRNVFVTVAGTGAFRSTFERASRTRARRWGSIRLAPRLLRRWHDTPILRIAVHPLDFDHPHVVEAVAHTIATALGDRTAETYEHVLADPQLDRASHLAIC